MKQATSKSMALEAQHDLTILPDHATTTFLLKAVAPGATRIEFQRVKGPPVTVTFPFQITR